MSAVSARLSAALQALTASHTLEASALEHFEKERVELDSQETELRREVVKTEEKSRWFGEFKDEVEDWSAFLDEKVKGQNLPQSNLRPILTMVPIPTVPATRAHRGDSALHSARTDRARYSTTLRRRRGRRRPLYGRERFACISTCGSGGRRCRDAGATSFCHSVGRRRLAAAFDRADDSTGRTRTTVPRAGQAQWR